MNKLALIILDGWGHGQIPEVSAIAQAHTPVMDNLYQKYPNAELTTFGESVGLPDGQMGNSEVGHINIGAGRVVYQELARINKAFREDELSHNPAITGCIDHALKGNKRIHLMGLVSDGGVHSHISHLLGLCALLQKHDQLEVYIHAFLDGRDTDPKSGLKYLSEVEQFISGSNIVITDVVGRYYAMDRDKRWERVKVAYDMLVSGAGKVTENIPLAISDSYASGVTDEFILPLIDRNTAESGRIKNDDAVIFFNFRTDRPRQITEVLTQKDMHEYNMHKLNLHFVSFTNYDQTFNGLYVVFEKDNLENTLGQVISEAGLTQVRIAETEKYPHVTFFFNGGKETSYPGEDRIMVPSPAVATYDLKPEMSAFEITGKLLNYIDEKNPDFICLNFANTDMVGHTGVFEAAVKAAETVDSCLGKLMDKLLENDYFVLVIADHGNSDMMINPDGTPNTAHTTNPVPVILAGSEVSKLTYSVTDGKLGDVAPTILSLMGLSIPDVMEGRIIARRVEAK